MENNNLMTSAEFREIVLEGNWDLREVAEDLLEFEKPSDYLVYTEEEDDLANIEWILSELMAIFSGVVELSSLTDGSPLSREKLISWAYLNKRRG